MIDYYEIGQRIRKCRKAYGLSQEDLAEKVGISTTHMSHIETGNTKLSLPVLADLSAALNTSADEFLFGEVGRNREGSVQRIAELLDGCDPSEICIIEETVAALKAAFGKYH